jgi:hypothetical protein
LKNPKARIATGKIVQDRALAMKMLFDAVKRENVTLQLEASYREQLVRGVFSEVFQLSFICFSFTEIRTSKPLKNRRTCCHQNPRFGHYETLVSCEVQKYELRKQLQMKKVFSAIINVL